MEIAPEDFKRLNKAVIENKNSKLELANLVMEQKKLETAISKQTALCNKYQKETATLYKEIEDKYGKIEGDITMAKEE